MRILERILDKIRPMFEENGRLARLRPAFDALDSFMFLPKTVTQNPPYGRDPLDVKRYMSLVITALIPSFLASLYFFGWRIILMLLVSYIAGGLTEVIFAIVRREEVNEGFLVTGFIFPLILPPGLPLWMVAVGIVFGVVVGKEMFGGTGRNLFNPALIGRVFLAIGYPATMTSAWISPGNFPAGRILSSFTIRMPESVTSATPLVQAKGGVFASTFDLFIGHITGSAGETSALAILIGGLFLIAIGVASWRTVFSILGSFIVSGFILRLAFPQSVNPLLFNLLSGGFLFGAFFMATDPVSSPITQRGKIYYGILIGVVTIIIRSFSGFVEGMMFAILFGNICAPLIDEVIVRSRIRRYAREGKY